MYLKKLTLAFIAFISSFALFISCDDEPAQFGLDVLPPDDKLEIFFNDTIEVAQSQILFNQERLINIEEMMNLGFYKDSIFGEIRASLLTQFAPRNIKELNLTQIDSIVSLKLMIVPELLYAGEKNASVAFDIFEVTKEIPRDTTYNFHIEDYYDYNSNIIGSFVLDEQGIKNGIEIPLSKNYAKKLFYTETLNKDTLLKGLCIVPRSYKNNGLLITSDFSYTSDRKYLNYLQLEIKNGKNDSIIHFILPSFSKYLQANINKINLVEHDYSKSNVSSGLNGNINDSLYYIINKGSYKMSYDFSNLSSFPKKSNIEVIKAELVLPVDTIFSKSLSTNTASILLYVWHDSLSYSYFPYKFVGDGYCYADKSNYYLDMTGYVQDFLTGKTSESKFVATINNNLASYNAVLKKNKKPVLKIKYKYY